MNRLRNNYVSSRILSDLLFLIGCFISCRYVTTPLFMLWYQCLVKKRMQKATNPALFNGACVPPGLRIGSLHSLCAGLSCFGIVGPNLNNGMSSCIWPKCSPTPIICRTSYLKYSVSGFIWTVFIQPKTNSVASTPRVD